jgi:hypothetical protein
MKLPFNLEQFLEVFRQYNQEVFPAQILIYILAVFAVILIVKKTSWSAKLINLILAFLWLWMGILYHLKHFAVINKAAYFFGGAFILQGMIFLFKGVIRNEVSFSTRNNADGLIGTVLILSSMILYPILSYYNGHFYPYTPTLGLPCPTTIFTLGILCLAEHKPRLSLWLIPLLWTLIGFSAALLLGMKEDYILFIAGIFAFLIFLKKKR